MNVVDPSLVGGLLVLLDVDLEVSSFNGVDVGRVGFVGLDGSMLLIDQSTLLSSLAIANLEHIMIRDMRTSAYVAPSAITLVVLCFDNLFIYELLQFESTKCHTTAMVVRDEPWRALL